MNRQKITTVGELRKFISNIDDSVQVCFADRDCLPCRPYKWYINNGAKEFIEEKIVEHARERYFKDMDSMNIKDNAIVIHAEF